jgi:hypothetical protein
VTCTTAKFEGTHLNNNTPTPTSTTTLTITPTYTGCQLHGLGINVTVNMNGCHYRFETPTVIPGTANHTTWHSNVTVVCPGTNVISVSGTGCTITVPGQTLGKVDYHLQGSGSTRDVLVNSTVTGITYNSHGFLCNNTTHRSNGTYSGEVTTKAFNAVTGNQVGAWIETHK